jgi:DNA topoisomerase IA
MYTLIVTEKPTSSKAIAEALADGKPAKKGVEGERAFWYEFSNNGHKFVCVPAVGHLFTLKQSDKGWAYPSFNVEWVPSFKASKFAASAVSRPASDRGGSTKFPGFTSTYRWLTCSEL